LKLFVTQFVQGAEKTMRRFEKNVMKIKKSKETDLVKFAFILYNLHVKLGQSLGMPPKMTIGRNRQPKSQTR